MTGWNVPPGVSLRDIDGCWDCAVCGESENCCPCPECPKCGAQGDPKCYDEHHMMLNREQRRLIMKQGLRDWSDEVVILKAELDEAVATNSQHASKIAQQYQHALQRQQEAKAALDKAALDC